MDVYDRLEEIDASTAEVRASAILRGLGFTHAMMNKQAKDFSGACLGVVLCK
jgi:ATP-binding cassette subfamily F protein 2